MATRAVETTAVEVVDLAETPLRELNQRLHDLTAAPGPRLWRVLNPNGAHAIGAGEIGKHTSELQSLAVISYAVFCLDRKSVV